MNWRRLDSGVCFRLMALPFRRGSRIRIFGARVPRGASAPTDRARIVRSLALERRLSRPDPAGRGAALSGSRLAPDARRRGRPRGQVRDPARGRGLRLRSRGVPRADPLLPDPASGLAPGRARATSRSTRSPCARFPRRSAWRSSPPTSGRGAFLGTRRRRGRGPPGRDLAGHGLLQPVLHPRDPARLLQLRRARSRPAATCAGPAPSRPSWRARARG